MEVQEKQQDQGQLVEPSEHSSFLTFSPDFSAPYPLMWCCLHIICDNKKSTDSVVMRDGLKSQQIKAIRGALSGRKQLLREVMGDFFFFF